MQSQFQLTGGKVMPEDKEALIMRAANNDAISDLMQRCSLPPSLTSHSTNANAKP